MRQIDEPNSAKRNSRLGIASTIIGGGLPLLVTALFIFYTVSFEIGFKNGSRFFMSLSKISSGIFVIVGMLAPVLHLIGLILGVIGAFSKETKKTFSIAGIILNLLFGLIGIGLVILYFFVLFQAMGGGWQ